ncbi:MAG: class V aminotransferase, partial [Brevundimonas sp.]
AFAGSTHDVLVRIVSGLERRPVRILTTDGEFHAFRRQAARWEEAGEAVVTRIPTAPVETLADRVVAAARAGGVDLIVVSQVFFRSGWSFDGVSALADLARPAGPWVVVDGYHSFMAVPTDLSGVADRIFYVSGGYKYAMSGEGAGLLHAPPGYCERPVITGWFAEFGNLQGPPDGVQYRADAGRFLGATYDSTPLYRFNFVRRMLDAEGLTTASIADHARGLQARFQAAIEAGSAGRLAEAEIVNPVAGDGPRARFLALRHPEAQAWRAKLLEANVVTDVREDILRFGFGIYQDPGDVDRAVEVCARVL